MCYVIAQDRRLVCEISHTGCPGSAKSSKPESGSWAARAANARSSACSGAADQSSAHIAPLGSARSMVRFGQSAATGSPRKWSIWPMVAAYNARATATSASWNTTWRLCRMIRAPILISFSRSVISVHCASLIGSARSNLPEQALDVDDKHGIVAATPSAAPLTDRLSRA